MSKCSGHKALFLLTALSAFFACSSDDKGSEAIVSCMADNICAEVSADACIALGGQLVQECGELPGISSSGEVSSPSQSSSSGREEVSSPSQSSSSGSEEVSSSSQSSSSSIVFGSVEHGGQTYKTVVIGEQTWMAENLNYNVPNSVCYDNDESNCDKYGRLYNWATAMALSAKCNYILSTEDTDCKINTPQQGICPIGYHIPTNEDWDKLLRYVDEQNDGEGYSGVPYHSKTAGKYLRSNKGWKMCGSTGIDTYRCFDTYGFSALPGGFHNGNSFFSSDITGYWWIAREFDSNEAYYRIMYNFNEDVTIEDLSKQFKFSVRCVKD